MYRQRWRLGVKGWVIAAGLLASTPLQAQDVMTTRQMEALSPREANRAAQRDLLSLFEPIGKIRRGMFVSLHGVGFHTHPVGTEFKGICRSDAVTMWYAPVEGRASRDTPVRPYSVTSSAAFHIIRLPAAGLSETNPAAPVFRDECDGLTGADVSWIGAEDAFHAAQGAILFDRARMEVLAGTFKLLSCPDIKETCQQAFGEMGDLTSLWRVATCSADEGMLCYVIDGGNETTVTIRARGKSEELLPGDLISVSLEQYIIVT